MCVEELVAGPLPLFPFLLLTRTLLLKPTLHTHRQARTGYLLVLDVLGYEEGEEMEWTWNDMNYN